MYYIVLYSHKKTSTVEAYEVMLLHSESGRIAHENKLVDNLCI